MESLLFWFHLRVLAWMGGEKGGGETMGGGGVYTYSFGRLSLFFGGGGGGGGGGHRGLQQMVPALAGH